MALTLVFSIGRAVYIDDEKFSVSRVGECGGAELKGPDGERYEIHSDKATEVRPGVLVSEGYKGEAHEVSLVFEAPRRVEILREQLWKRKNTVVRVDD